MFNKEEGGMLNSIFVKRSFNSDAKNRVNSLRNICVIECIENNHTTPSRYAYWLSFRGFLTVQIYHISFQKLSLKEKIGQ